MKNKNNQNRLVIYIGGDMEKDERELFENPEAVNTQPFDAIYVRSYDQLGHMLPPAKLDLLWHIIETGKTKKNVGQIAQDLGRQQEAISRDLRFLHAFKLIELHKSGKNVYPHTRIKSISIETVRPQARAGRQRLAKAKAV